MKDQELLSAYLDGELSPDQVREVEDRLGADPRLREEHLRLLQVSAILRIECEPDPGFLVRHRERREDLSPILSWTWRQLGYRLSAVAAALLVAAGLSVWQAERPEAAPLANADPVAGEPDLFPFGSEVLAVPELEALAETDPADEPVLLIALGGGLSPAGER